MIEQAPFPQDFREPGMPAAWNMRLPFWPWNHAKAVREREDLLAMLRGAYPQLALWTNENFEWQLLAPGEPLPEGEWRDYGGWTMIFSGAAQTPAYDAEAAEFPRSLPAALDALARTGANAAVWSWHDDTEWVVALRPESRS